MPTIQNSNSSIRIFYSYAHEDKRYKEKLARHLSSMKREGLITEWDHDLDIKPGQRWEQEINKNLLNADIILLLVSSNFMASDYCSTIEMETALQRFNAGEAWVIPVIIHSVDWKYSQIGDLQALPYKGKPVVEWNNQHKAFYNVAQDIRRVVNDIRNNKSEEKTNHADSTNQAEPLPPKKSPVMRKKRSLYKTLKEARKDRSIGEKLRDTVTMIENNFSIEEIKKRSKSYSSILLFLFGIFNIIVLPTLIYNWLVNPLITFSTFIVSAILFMIGISSKNDITAAPLTFLYFIAWLAVEKGYIINYYHINLSLIAIIILSALISCLQLVLFRKRTKRRWSRLV